MNPSVLSHVLVADDDTNVRAVLRDVLQEEGYTVHQTSHGEQTLDFLRAAASPLVVLLNWWMPILTGDEVLRIVEQDAVLRRRHAYIFTTAYFTLHPHARRAGSLLEVLGSLQVPLLLKPFDLDVVLRVVGEAARDLSERAG